MLAFLGLGCDTLTTGFGSDGDALGSFGIDRVRCNGVGRARVWRGEGGSRWREVGSDPLPDTLCDGAACNDVDIHFVDGCDFAQGFRFACGVQKCLSYLVIVDDCRVP